MAEQRWGVVIFKDLMVPARDGTLLATDVYRPARAGAVLEDPRPAILCRTPYDKTDKRYTEIAEHFVPRGYVVALQDLRDRFRSGGTKEYFHVAAPHTGTDGYDTVEWIAAQPWSNGRVGMVGSSYAGIGATSAALERPPHLTAIWPDVVPTNMYANQTREGGVLQIHMIWALLIHAQDAQDVADDDAKRAEVWDDLRRLRELLWEAPWKKGTLSLRHVPALDQTLEDYTTRGAYDEYWARKANDFTRHWHEHADIPATMSTGWFDPFCAADGDYYATMVKQNRSPQRLVIGPWSHVGMRGEATWSLDVDFGEASRWGVKRYFDEQQQFFDRWLPADAPGAPAGELPVRIFVMGGGTGRRTAEGKLDHGGFWREEREWPLARAVPTEYFLHADGGLRRDRPAAGAAPREYDYDPAHPVPTIGGLYSAVGELPEDGPGIEQAWSRLLNPMLRLRNVLTPGSADQREAPEFFASRPPYPRLSERPDVLVYQTEVLREPVEVTGQTIVELWIASSALDTDFTAKLVDVHPPNEDYPDGYDMLLTDSVIRCRYREGFDHEVLMLPGTPYQVRIVLQPTSNVFGRGHRIRVDISSSNFPRLERNPNTGEAIGRHTHEAVAHQTVFSDGERASKVVLPLVAGV